jgi:hypothetical protein
MLRIDSAKHLGFSRCYESEILRCGSERHCDTISQPGAVALQKERGLTRLAERPLVKVPDSLWLQNCHSCEPTAGRQLLKRLSTRLSISMPIIPVSAKIRTPTKTLSVWKVAPATVIIKPIPAVAA